jgi:cytosine deaminase
VDNVSKHDIVIRNARLRGGVSAEIGIDEGSFVQIAKRIPAGGQVELDAEGGLVTESYVIGQLHLDKVFTGSWLDATATTEYTTETMGGAMTAIELASEVKRRYEEREVAERVARALTEAEFAGVSHVRAFVDVDTTAGLVGLKGVLKARERFAGRIDVQVVSFPQDGLLRDPGAEELVAEGLELGADVVGGIPWIEYTDADVRRHVDMAFDLARRFDRPISMLVDDAGDPNLRSLEYFAVRAVEEGWQGRVSACHARAMSLYNEVYHRKVIALLKRAQMGIVTNPHTGPLHVRIKDLTAEGVPLAIGGESVNDAYYPFGRANMLEAAFVVAHTAWMWTAAEQELLYDMITTQPARILGLASYGLAEGNAADCVVLPVDTVRDALAYHPEPRYVIRNGRLICESRSERIRHD